MARKVPLLPLQNGILWVLEEAGEETVATVRATVKADEEALDREIAALERLVFVQRGTQDGRASLVLSACGRMALTT